MLATPDTRTIDMGTLHSELNMPYTLTPGRAAGLFLAEMGNRRIVGSRFKSGLVIAPAQDFSPVDGESDPELVEAKEVVGKISQIRVLSTQRLGKKIGQASDEELEAVIEGLNEIIGA